MATTKPSFKPVSQIHREQAAQKKVAAPAKKPAAKAPAKAPAKAAAKPAPKPVAAPAKPQAPEKKVYDIETLILDPELQQRQGGSDEAIAKEYAVDLNNGDEFPAIDVFLTPDKELLVVDGFKRVMAHTMANLSQITARVHKGTRDDALWFSCAANRDHGQRRTNEDKRKAVYSALLLERTRSMSDRVIAEHCGVSSPVVGRTRAEMVKNGVIPASAERVTSDGKVVAVDSAKKSAAGQKSAASRAAPVEAEADVADDAALLEGSEVASESGDESALLDEEVDMTPVTATKAKAAPVTATVNDGVLLDASDTKVPEELRPVFEKVDLMHKLVQAIFKVAYQYRQLCDGPAGTFLDPGGEELLGTIANGIAAGTPYLVDPSYDGGWQPAKPESVQYNSESVPAGEYDSATATEEESVEEEVAETEATEDEAEAETEAEELAGDESALIDEEVQE